VALEWTYRIQVSETWRNGRAPDPETYWLNREEAVTLLDALLGNIPNVTTAHGIGMITVTPYLQTPVASLEWE